MTPIKRQLVEFKCTNSSTFLKKTFYYRLDKSTLMLGRAKGPKTSSLMVKECVRASKVFIATYIVCNLHKSPAGTVNKRSESELFQLIFAKEIHNI